MVHLLRNAVICASTVLECSCYRLHRFVAAPLECTLYINICCERLNTPLHLSEAWLLPEAACTSPTPPPSPHPYGHKPNTMSFEYEQGGEGGSVCVSNTWWWNMCENLCAYSSRHRFILIHVWHEMRQKQVSSHAGSCLFIMFIMKMPFPQRMRARVTAARERWNLGAKAESLCKLSLTFSPYHLACFFYVRVVFY